MEHKLQRLIELRAQQEKTNVEIAQLVTELTGIIQPRKRKKKTETKTETPKTEKLPKLPSAVI